MMRSERRKPVLLGDNDTFALHRRSVGEEEGHMDGTS